MFLKRDKEIHNENKQKHCTTMTAVAAAATTTTTTTSYDDVPTKR